MLSTRTLRAIMPALAAVAGKYAQSASRRVTIGRTGRDLAGRTRIWSLMDSAKSLLTKAFAIVLALGASFVAEGQTPTNPDFKFHSPTDNQDHQVHVEAVRGGRLKIFADGSFVGMVQTSDGKNFQALGGAVPGPVLIEAAKQAFQKPEAQGAQSDTVTTTNAVGSSAPQATAGPAISTKAADVAAAAQERANELLLRATGREGVAGGGTPKVEFSKAGDQVTKIVVKGIIRSDVTLSPDGTTITFNDARQGAIEMDYATKGDGKKVLGAAGALVKGSVAGGAEVNLANHFYSITIDGHKSGTTGDHTAGASFNSERKEGQRRIDMEFAKIASLAIQAAQSAAAQQNVTFSPPDAAVSSLNSFSKNVRLEALRVH